MNDAILVVGASGWLGRQVLMELGRLGLPIRVLLRGGTAHPLASEFAELGAEIMVGDIADKSSLLRATESVHTIVSAVRGGPEVIVDGQLMLAEAGRINGVSRIFTSDFSVRFDGVTPEEHLFLNWRAQAHAAIASTGLAQVHPLNGAFTEMLTQEFFGLIDWRKRAVEFWGDPDQIYQFTLTADVARYVAAAAQDRDLPAGHFEMVGDTASPRQLAALAGEATGSTFSLDQLGSLEALDSEIARRKLASPSEPAHWAGLQYHRLMARGDSLLRAPQNARYPVIVPTTIRSFMTGLNRSNQQAST